MDDDVDVFTFAAAAPLAGGGIFPGDHRIGALLYPVFGRPRSPPRRRATEPESTATARVPLARHVLVDRGPPARALNYDCVLDKEPAETCYFPWCPGSPAAASPARPRCRKSGSTGSIFRWHQRLVGRSHSDGKEKFVFLDANPSQRKGTSGGIGGHDWSYYAKGGSGGNGGRWRSFLPYKQDLVGLFASSTAFRRSYHPF